MVRTARTNPDNKHESITNERGARDRLMLEPISAAEYAARKALMERMFARRNEQEYLNIPSDQLVRESRAEAYGADER